MEIKVTQTVNVPRSPYCGNCARKNKDRNDLDFCELFTRYIYAYDGRLVKCRECYDALYEAVTQED